jgi:Terminase large subunit, T4likevirus-type, N-terminal
MTVARKRLGVVQPVQPLSILDAVDDPAVFGQHFRNLESWKAWRTFLATLFGLHEQIDPQVFMECTSRQKVATAGYREAWLVCGRRSGKSFMLSLIAVFLGTFRDWRPYLGPGEHATVMVIAADRKQARVIMRYVVGLLHSVPMLARIIEAQTRETITLRNRVVIEVHSASFRSTRGYTIVAALCDELAFWPTDDLSAEPDVEVLNALRPGMATIPGSMLLCASSPYARRGALWDAHRKHYGNDTDPILVWQAATRLMNSTVPQGAIDEATELCPASAAAEYLAQFRSDVESFIAREVVDAAVQAGRYAEKKLIACPRRSV